MKNKSLWYTGACRQPASNEQGSYTRRWAMSWPQRHGPLRNIRTPFCSLVHGPRRPPQLQPYPLNFDITLSRIEIGDESLWMRHKAPAKRSLRLSDALRMVRLRLQSNSSWMICWFTLCIWCSLPFIHLQNSIIVDCFRDKGWGRRRNGGGEVGGFAVVPCPTLNWGYTVPIHDFIPLIDLSH